MDPAATYHTVFRQAFASSVHALPYTYQCRLACGPDADPEDASTLTRGTVCQSQLINIPTGLGKTAAVILAWLWNRVLQPDEAAKEKWPRRVVYCLPMRTLVEQTAGEVKKWIDTILADGKGELALNTESKAKLQWLSDHSPVILMGGEDAGEWDIFPEKPAILIGTQDMLLSRALNRGYGMARARWPMHFGLLNNDALWVLDETQLMGVGLSTSAQLDGLRTKIGTAIGCATWWTSATLDPRPLLTPDHPSIPPALRLGEDDLQEEAVQNRIHAVKRLSPLPLSLASDAVKFTGPYIEQLAAEVLERHQPDSTTIVIINRVNRAQDLFAAIERRGKKQTLPPRVLVHSRFRSMEREVLSQRIMESGEKIIIATQAIEAGVDLSSRTLITELAPWASLVQRFGRCNRKGEYNDQGGADIFWINLQAEDEKAASGLALPYTPEQLVTARTLLVRAELNGASPSALHALEKEDEPLPDVHILRRKDLIELFDTTPDLAGLDIDVGRYIRDGASRDVQVYWRNEFEDGLPKDGIVPLREELVRVPLASFKKFTEKNKPADKSSAGIWLWSVLDGRWQQARAEQIAPGQIYLIDAALGGYSPTLGWTGDKSKEPFPLRSLDDQPKRNVDRDGQDTDDLSQTARKEWQSIEEHTAFVVGACEDILQKLPAAAPWAEALTTAARWHDAGKAHEAFQQFITAKRDVPPDLTHSFIAKSPWKPGIRFENRPHFRHELASAFAWLQAGNARDPIFQNLVAYLIATHHGKVRLSIRAMPGERTPEESAEVTPLFARGVWQDDSLPPAGEKILTLEGFPSEGIRLDLSCMQMGEADGSPSWTARALSLRDSRELGIFRLAWLETLLRAADAQASILAIIPLQSHDENHDLHRAHPAMALSFAGAQAADPMGGDSPGRDSEHGVRKGTGAGGDDSRDTRPDRATRYLDTTLGVLSYTELAPHLAERVTRLEAATLGEEFAARPLDENLLADFHARICGDLTPEWAGKWRTVAVTVGSLAPPPPYQLPMLMRDYGLDLQARWKDAASNDIELTLEFLAIAEGRFLTIHPFRDFNGRTIRVFLLELLRRLDLPRVELAPATEGDRARYFAALEAADSADWRPLIEIWKERFTLSV